ncbi:MAG TPA: hypothetical protein GX521_03665, partial [Firmicutes bacterium]|nr:hypothetical protein [Bacillota bacterium]
MSWELEGCLFLIPFNEVREVEQSPLIVVVGVCASGKTTLFNGLRRLGYRVRSFAQEHSVTATTWKRLEPDFLILLDCRYETVRARKNISWGPARFRQQQKKLANARQFADLIIATDDFTPQQLVAYVHHLPRVDPP